MSDRRFLSIVRAGIELLHLRWLVEADSRSCDMIDDPDRGIALLERVAVTHTHPIGGSNDRILRESGKSPRVEPRAFSKKHDIDPKMATHHAIGRDGRPLTAGRSHRLFGLRPFVGSVATMRQSSDRGRVVCRMCKFITGPLTQAPYRIADLNATSL